MPINPRSPFEKVDIWRLCFLSELKDKSISRWENITMVSITYLEHIIKQTKESRISIFFGASSIWQTLV